MTNEERTIDLPELTARLGLAAHEQSAVQAWSGEDYGHRWTEEEAADLTKVWQNTGADGVYRP